LSASAAPAARSIGPEQGSAGSPGAVLVACIEAGPLEPMTVRMVESLRRHGGRLSGLELKVVTARLGPPLRAETVRRLKSLGAEVVRSRGSHRYVWHHLLHKFHAMLTVEESHGAETVIWLDSDLLFLEEPAELLLGEDEDFTAMPSMGIIGSKGPEDPNDAFWGRATRSLGVELESLPWVITAEDGDRIRFYLNGGLFSYRRSCGLARKVLADCEGMLDARVPRKHIEAHLLEQATVGLSVHRHGLRWRALSPKTNFNVTCRQPELIKPEVFRGVTVLHYHDSMEAHTWERLLGALAESHPHVHAWLKDEGAVVDPTPGAWRGVREGLRVWRGVQRRLYYRACGFRKD
jgi:predicted RNA binding protein YcfA (HicA-like mRNA interferase family)